MATVEKKTETKVTNIYTLILDEDEAVALRHVLGKVSGSSSRSRRRHLSSVYRELGVAGVKELPYYISTGSIKFEDEE